MTDTLTTPLQGGMSNADLLNAWRQKLPNVVANDDEMTAFALGVEVGVARSVLWLRGVAAEKWSAKEKYPRHWEAYPSWGIVASQVSWLADDLERTAGTPSSRSAAGDQPSNGHGPESAAPQPAGTQSDTERDAARLYCPYKNAPERGYWIEGYCYRAAMGNQSAGKESND